MDEQKRSFEQDTERLVRKHDSDLKQKDREVQKERGNFLKAQHQIDELQKKLKQWEQNGMMNADIANDEQNHRARKQHMAPELTKSELIIQKCEKYISN